jgi:hypothetical protein
MRRQGKAIAGSWLVAALLAAAPAPVVSREMARPIRTTVCAVDAAPDSFLGASVVLTGEAHLLIADNYQWLSDKTCADHMVLFQIGKPAPRRADEFEDRLIQSILKCGPGRMTVTVSGAMVRTARGAVVLEIRRIHAISKPLKMSKAERQRCERSA